MGFGEVRGEFRGDRRLSAIKDGFAILEALRMCFDRSGG